MLARLLGNFVTLLLLLKAFLYAANQSLRRWVKTLPHSTKVIYSLLKHLMPETIQKQEWSLTCLKVRRSVQFHPSNLAHIFFQLLAGEDQA